MHHGIEIYQRPLRHDRRRRLHRVTKKAPPLPAFKDALFCRGFGHAWRKTVGALSPQTRCTACILSSHCAYTRLFETDMNGAPPRFLRGLEPAPRPLIFESLDSHFNFHPGAGIKNGWRPDALNQIPLNHLKGGKSSHGKPNLYSDSAGSAGKGESGGKSH